MRGCWPAHEPLPLAGPGPGLVSPVCELQEAEHVSTCLCHVSGCNAPDSFRSRDPKQIVFPSDPAARTGRQSTGLRCFSCGSLFDRSAPRCDKVRGFSMLSQIFDTIFVQFNPDDNSQVGTCGPGEACMLYTWKKSSSEIGSYRECFKTSIQVNTKFKISSIIP